MSRRVMRLLVECSVNTEPRTPDHQNGGRAAGRCGRFWATGLDEAEIAVAAIRRAADRARAARSG
jgi:hypothetical protein